MIACIAMWTPQLSVLGFKAFHDELQPRIRIDQVLQRVAQEIHFLIPAQRMRRSALLVGK